MTASSALNAPMSVPNRYAVPKVSRVSPATLDLKGPLNGYTRVQPDDERQKDGASRGQYGINVAAPGFAAHILVEAGLTGSDPFAGMRAAKAYQAETATRATVRLIA
jgi:hypothetical protein